MNFLFYPETTLQHTSVPPILCMTLVPKSYRLRTVYGLIHRTSIAHFERLLDVLFKAWCCVASCQRKAKCVRWLVPQLERVLGIGKSVRLVEEAGDVDTAQTEQKIQSLRDKLY